MFTFIVILAGAIFVPYVAAPAVVDGAKSVITRQSSPTAQDSSAALKVAGDAQSSRLLTATPFQYADAN